MHRVVDEIFRGWRMDALVSFCSVGYLQKLLSGDHAGVVAET